MTLKIRQSVCLALHSGSWLCVTVPRSVAKRSSGSEDEVKKGGDVAHLVERRTGMFSSPAGQGFVLPESTCTADALTMSLKLSCAIARINVCAHVNDPKHYLYLSFWHRKITYSLVGMGSDTLAAAANLPRKGGPNFLQGINEVVKWRNENEKTHAQSINQKTCTIIPDKHCENIQSQIHSVGI